MDGCDVDIMELPSSNFDGANWGQERTLVRSVSNFL